MLHGDASNYLNKTLGSINGSIFCIMTEITAEKGGDKSTQC